MAESSIPVDLLNPGQVFACLGFMEAADVLLGSCQGGFDWTRPVAEFSLRAIGDRNPFEVVLEFLAEARIEAVAPKGWEPPRSQKRSRKSEQAPTQGDESESGEDEALQEESLLRSDTFPCRPFGKDEDKLAMKLPVQLSRGNKRINLSHWADGSSRTDFKLYAGNRSAFSIAEKMLLGVRAKGKRGKSGEFKNLGIAHLWRAIRERLVAAPFGELVPLGGRFNLDANGAWTALDSGYSLDEQEHDIEASPVVELLAAVGLENARPVDLPGRGARYAAWRGLLPLSLARVAIAGTAGIAELCPCRFIVDLAGKNKVATTAQKEVSS